MPLVTVEIAFRVRQMVAVLAFVLALLPGGLRAAEVVGDVKVEPAGAGAVTIRWRTDVESGGRVNYGTAENALTGRAEGGITADHAVTVTGLKTGTQYYYNVGTARKKLAAGSFTTQGSPSSIPATAPSTSPAKPEKAKTLTSPASKPSGTAASAPPTRQTWGSMASLQDHFERHGADFRSRDADDYAAQAWAFRQRALAGSLQMKLDEDGVLRVFDPATGAFAAYNRDGTTKTYFKPGSRDYFARQPGRVVAPRDVRQLVPEPKFP